MILFLFSLLISSALSQNLFSPVLNTQLLLNPIPEGVVFLDCNEDGLTDHFRTANMPGNNRFIVINNGDGTFESTVINMGDRGASMGDYDNDGDIDLATNVGMNQQVQLLTNDGNCTFTPTLISIGNPGAEAPILVDIDYDGDLDVWFPSNMFLWIENTDLTPPGFISRTVLPGGASLLLDATTTTVIDLNNDQTIDLLYYVGSPPQTVVFTGDPQLPGQNYTLQPPEFMSLPQNLGMPRDIVGFVWADCNGDGLVDLFAHDNDVLGEVGLYINNGTDFVGPQPPRQNVATTGGDFGDFDQDGDLDLVLNGLAGDAQIWVNDGNCGFTLVQTLNNQQPGAGGWIDYDNDGDLDILFPADLYENNLNQVNFLKVLVRGDPALVRTTIPIGAQVEIRASLNQTIVATRELNGGYGLFQPKEVFTFGVEPTNTRYDIQVEFIHSRTVTTYHKCRAANLNTTVGLTVLQQTLNVTEDSNTPLRNISCTFPPRIDAVANEFETDEDGLIGFQVSISHDDLGPLEQLSVQIEVDNGEITLPSLPNIIVLVEEAQRVNFTGTLIDINNALALTSLSDNTRVSITVNDSPTGPFFVSSTNANLQANSGIDNQSTLATGAIIGVAVGASAFVIIIVCVVLILIFWVQAQKTG